MSLSQRSRELQARIIARMTVADFPREDLQLAAETIGVETLVRLLMEMPGSNLYLSRRWAKGVVQKAVTEFYDGNNTRELAAALGTTMREVQRAVNRKARRFGPPNPDQMKLV